MATPKPSGLCVVLVTAPDPETAAGIARPLIEDRLAACVNVLPGVRSLYRWEGSVQDDAEVLMIVKTSEPRLEALTERIRTLHPYDVPEVLALPVLGGNPDYLDWVLSESSR